MNPLGPYRAVLILYPRKFREQFSDEMTQVFQEVVNERLHRGKNLATAFVIAELAGLLIGALRMWGNRTMRKYWPKYFVFSVPFFSTRFPRPTAEENALGITELKQRFGMAQANMFQAASDHDFISARHFEAEAARLRLFIIRQSQSPKA